MHGTSSDPSAAHRLAYGVEPRRYEIHLAPDLSSATFHGVVRIEVDIHDAVDAVELHAVELTIESAHVVPSGGAAVALTATLDDERERLVLAATHRLEKGPALLDIRFTGTLNDKLHGFYRSTFVDSEGEMHTIATTQFEATDARRAFPCFDEPDRKAVFSVTLDVPPGLSAYSNGPVVAETALPDGGRQVRFGDTIPMSTYLVAFVVGPLVATGSVDAGGTALRVVHVPGKEDLTGFALDCAAHALTFFTEWFGIDYPADKLDLVAIPDFAFGAMENLGCVTFRESVLLVDPARASRLELERVADVISHEIAHMWFGDLVTMKWWNGIWLNEAFATLMEVMCVDHYRPEWQRWVSFGKERDVAMSTDSLHSTRPVEYPVGPPEEAQGMFDVLTYQKGGSVLRMLERFLGAERFRDGIRRYLSAHRFGNTETADLWSALEEASGEPVRDIMDTWILQGGFPLITVEEDASADGSAGRALTVTQEPFSFTPAHGPSAIGASWRVPLMVRAGLGAGATVSRILLGDGPARLDAPGAGGADGAAMPVIVNSGGSGYYRSRYTSAAARDVAANFSALEPLERYDLLSDAWAAVVAGKDALTAYMGLAEALGDEGDPDVWAEVTGPLSFLDHAVDDEPRPVVAAYTRALLHLVLARLGWEAGAGDGERTPTLRALVISALGIVGQDEGVRQQAAELHRQATSGGAGVDPDLASAIVAVVAAHGGEGEYQEFLERYRHPSTPQEELRYLYALTGFPEPELAARTFELAVTEVRTQNAPFVVQALLSHRDHGPATWSKVRDRWDELTARFPSNIFPRMLDGVKLLCRRAELAEEIRVFIAAHPLSAGQRTVDQTLERLDVNVAVAARLRTGVASELTAGVGRMADR